ncbi:MAG: sulfite exporter TauE/SafE family protein [Ignavibacterium sp.]|nr:sulfite exporter TauE/SafE family protein [Ignavibacterium sp.]MDW8376111.1 sulfite exporter TauE/SafE family protein [Ignavibacteriales bacterium]
MQTILTLIFLGALAGFSAGFLGIGGGVIVIPGLVYLLKYSQLEAQGTSLAMMLPPIGLFAVYNYYNSGYVNLKAAVILIVAFMIASYFSSKIAINIQEEIVKKAFAIFLVIYAAKLFFDK